MINKIDKYLVSLLGILIIFLAMSRDILGIGRPGIGVPQLFLVAVGTGLAIAGYKFSITPISYLRNLLYRDKKMLIKVVFVFTILFVFVDLLLGMFFPKIHTSTKYGWSVPAHTKLVRTVQDTKDSSREVTNEYFAHGFKRWPINPDDKPRALVIGDSFTQMVHVDNGEEWYAFLEQEFPRIAFYVFGGGGYGTLQEYMVLDDRFDDIKPNAIIWQFCSNDYVNNHYELDRGAYPYNNFYVRPYWQSDEAVYRLPLPYPMPRKYSLTADMLLSMYDRKRKQDVVSDLDEYTRRREDRISNLSLKDKQALEDYKNQAEDVTKVLAEKVRLRSGDIPIYFFNACGNFTKNDRAVCKAGGFRCLDFMGNYMDGVESSGVQIRVENDGHWNHEGNRYAGEKLAEYFKQNGGLIHNNRN